MYDIVTSVPLDMSCLAKMTALELASSSDLSACAFG